MDVDDENDDGGAAMAVGAATSGDPKTRFAVKKVRARGGGGGGGGGGRGSGGRRRKEARMRCNDADNAGKRGCARVDVERWTTRQWNAVALWAWGT